MRFRALHEFTAKLPLFSKENFIEEISFIGNSTETSMVSGVVNGTLREIEGFVSMYGGKFENLQVVFCGGDAAFLSEKVNVGEIKSEHQKDLLFIGLNTILLYNQV
jgi:type III pantothenate kinase